MPDLDIGRLIGYVELDDAGVAAGAQSVKERIGELGKSGAGLAKAAGIGIGLAVAGGLAGAMDIEQGRAKLTAQLDLSAADSARLGKVAGKLYGDAYGESMDEVNDAIRGVVQNIGGMADASDADLERVSGKVLSVSQAFDQDLGGVTRAVGTMLRSGLAKDADEALDVLTRGFQNGTNVADDLLDTFSEYSTQFRKLGLDGTTATGLLSQGLKGGARDADTVADALKELSIRAIDGSEATGTAYRTLGLNGEDMTRRFAAGGKTASGALDLVLDKLRGTTDPATRSAAAVGLFGTKAEDLGAALYDLDLDTAADGMGRVDGAAQRVADTLGGTAAAQFTSLKRSAENFATSLGGAVLPVVSDLGGTVLDVVAPALETVGGLVGDVTGFFGALPGPVKDVTVVLAGLALMRNPIAGAFTGIKKVASSALESVQLRAMYARDAIGAAGGLTGAVGGMGAAAAGAARGGLGGLSTMLGGPLGLAIAGVTLAVPLLSSLFDDNSDSADDAAYANSDLAAALRATGGAIDDTVRRAAAKEAADKGLIETAKQIGVSSSDMVDAILGQGDAMDRVQAAAAAYVDKQRDAASATDAAGEATFGSVDAHSLAAAATESQVRALEALAGKTDGQVGKERELADAVEGTGDQTDQTTRATEDLEKAYDALKDSVDRYLGTNKDAAEAQLDVLDGLADLTDQTHKQGATLDRTTKAGRDNERAILDQFSAIADLTTATYKQTGSSDKAREAWDREVGTLRAKLLALGYNEDQVNDLINTYGRVPDSVWTQVGTNAGGVLGTITTLKDRLETISRGTYYVDVYTTSNGGKRLGVGYGATGGIVSYYAAGGLYDPVAGRNLTPLAVGVAARVPANTWRVIGDRAVGDEFYLPDDDAPKSLAIGAEWLRRRGLAAVPLTRYADGGLFAAEDAAAAGPSSPTRLAGGRRDAPLVEFTGPVNLRDQRDAIELADQIDWRRRTRGRRR